MVVRKLLLPPRCVTADDRKVLVGQVETKVPAPASAMQLGIRVQGAITGRDVIRHSFTILRLWGPGCYVRCIRALVSRRPCTFLGIITLRA